MNKRTTKKMDLITINSNNKMNNNEIIKQIIVL